MTDLSEQSLEDAIVAIKDRGEKLNILPNKLILSGDAIKALEELFPGVVIDQRAVDIIWEELYVSREAER